MFASLVSPFGLLQVTQVLVGHVLLPLLVHLLRREPLHAIQHGCREHTKKHKHGDERQPT